MKEISINKINKVLSDNKNVAFTYIFGSAAKNRSIKDGSDLDMAVYFYKDPDLDQVYEFILSLEKVMGEDVLDLLVLNGCEDFILRNEVINGHLIYCRDTDLFASFFSWTLRMYEDQILRIQRNTA